MKTVIRVYRWIIISVILQAFILLFLNNVYLTDSPLELNIIRLDNVITLDLPASSTSPKVSYDGLYAAYTVNGKLEVVETKTKNILKSISHDNASITSFEWLYDRTMLVYGLKLSNGVQVATYDAGNDNAHEYPKIQNLPKDSEIVNIEASALTNLVYTKIKVGNKQAKLYKINIMDQLSYITETSDDANIRRLNHVDVLAYQNGEHKIYIKNGYNASKALPFKTAVVLLGVDANDNIYAGALGNDGKVNKVYYGKHTDDIKKWTELEIKKPVEPSDIYVYYKSGKVFTGTKNSSLHNIPNDDKIDFKGSFSQMVDGYVVSVEKNELRLKELKD